MEPVSVVTGAARGIGRGTTLRLLEDGHRVAALDVETENLKALLEAAQHNPRLSTIECDVASEQQVVAAFAAVVKQHGRIQNLVNNAALSDPNNAKLPELTLADWRRVLSINLDGAFLCCRAFVQQQADPRGAIVNIASTRALQSEPNSEAYATSKGGLLALTHALAISLGPKIRVNAVSPGWIDTSAHQPGAAPLKLTESDHQQHPVGRVGKVADVAGAICYLLSEQSSFITGQNLVIDGGMTRKMIYAK